MGYNSKQWKFVNKSFRKTGLMGKGKSLPVIAEPDINEKYYGMKMLDVGCQLIKERLKKKLWKNKKSKRFPARVYFKSIGINYTSIDITACHGSLQVDLRKPIDEKFHNYFDIIINSGTTEHVEPIRFQYESFRNIHKCAKKNSVMIHMLPTDPLNSIHCHVYYDYNFYKTLAGLNNYKLVCTKYVKRGINCSMIGACFVKMEDNDFSKDRDKFFKYIRWVD